VNKKEGNSFNGGGGAPGLPDSQDAEFSSPIENVTPKKNAERPLSSLKKVQSPKPHVIFQDDYNNKDELQTTFEFLYLSESLVLE
jgi:CRP-like cAMP-binding protein